MPTFGVTGLKDHNPPGTMKKQSHNQQSNILAQNKKAFADFEILEKFEAGIVLTGPEVKSARASQINLKGTFIEISPQMEAWVRNIHISPYKQAAQADYNPTRKRKLLLNKNEIVTVKKNLETKGLTVIPLDFHLSGNHIKVTIGVCRSKKKYDRRAELKKKSQNLEIKRVLKHH
jgi:SsrA-binding protein